MHGQAVGVRIWLFGSSVDQQLRVYLSTVHLVGFHLARKIVIEIVFIVRNSEE